MADVKQQYAGLKSVPGQMGYQVITRDGAVILSSGDLQNRDGFASTVAKMVSVADFQPLNEQYKRINVYYDAHYYSICRAGDKIFVVKCRFDSTEPVNT